MPSPTKLATKATGTTDSAAKKTTAILGNGKQKGMASHQHASQSAHHQLFQSQSEEQHQHQHQHQQHHLNPGMAAFVAPAEGQTSQSIAMPYGTLQLASPAQQEAFGGMLGPGHVTTGLSDDDDDEGDEDESATSGGGKRKRANSRTTPNKTPHKSASTSSSSASTSTGGAATTSRAGGLAEVKGERDAHTGRRKIRIEFIEDDSRRHITFSKRKAGIMKKYLTSTGTYSLYPCDNICQAYELATLTGTQVLLLVVSQTGLVYTFTTPKLQPIVATDEGRDMIQRCLSKPDLPAEGAGKGGEHDDEDDDDDEGEAKAPFHPQAMQQQQHPQQQQQQHHHHQQQQQQHPRHNQQQQQQQLPPQQQQQQQQQHSMPPHQQQYPGMAPYPDPRLNAGMHGLSDLGDMSGLTMGSSAYGFASHQQQHPQHHPHAHPQASSQHQQSQSQQGGQSHHQTDQHGMPYANYGL